MICLNQLKLLHHYIALFFCHTQDLCSPRPAYDLYLVELLAGAEHILLRMSSRLDLAAAASALSYGYHHLKSGRSRMPVSTQKD